MTWMHGKADQTMLLKPSENDTVPLPQVTRLCMRNESYHPDSRESQEAAENSGYPGLRWLWLCGVLASAHDSRKSEQGPFMLAANPQFKKPR